MQRGQSQRVSAAQPQPNVHLLRIHPHGQVSSLIHNDNLAKFKTVQVDDKLYKFQTRFTVIPFYTFNSNVVIIFYY